MICPVLWVSRHADVLSRRYADEGFLEAVLARAIWNPRGGVEWQHYEDIGRPGSEWPDAFPAVDGAVVVLPARHHASEGDVSWFLAQLNRLSWSVVILAGDEDWEFPWQRVTRTPTRHVWIMQPRPEHSGLDGLIPGGWYPGTREGIDALTGPRFPRPRNLPWFFAGQVTHARREECAKVLRALGPEPGQLVETAGYLQGIPQREYLDRLSFAKVIPCPSGPMTVDTARPLEALEAACVPVVDTVTPRGEDYDYWSLVFGDDCPLPRIRDWSEFPAILQRELEGWPGNSNRLSAWWQGWKRSVVQRLHDDVRAVSGQAFKPEMPDDLLTVLVTTSAVPPHPSTVHLDETVRAIREQLPTAEIVVAFDGVRPEQEHRRDDYEEYVRRALWLCNFEWRNVVPFVAGEWLHQAELTRRALTLVRTPLLLFVEHDRPPMGDIDWAGLCRLVLSGEVNVVRLHAEAEIHPDHQHLMLDREPIKAETPYRRTMAWWQHPHVIRPMLLKILLDDYFSPDERTFIEDRLYQVAENDWFDDGHLAWKSWRLAIYQPPGDMKRSYHLDSRGNGPKLPNVRQAVSA